MSDLHQRVTAVINAHRILEKGIDFIDCRCGEADFTPPIRWAEHVAEMLIQEFDMK